MPPNCTYNAAYYARWAQSLFEKDELEKALVALELSKTWAGLASHNSGDVRAAIADFEEVEDAERQSAKEETPASTNRGA